jgi:MYXO-CTERM domain-containing protein
LLNLIANLVAAEVETNLKFHCAFLTSCLLLSPAAVFSSPFLITGTPGDALLSTPTGPSPNLNYILLDFSTLTPFDTFGSYSADGVTISSPDGLSVLPYSTQTANPNELFDTSSDGSANIKIATSFATTAIGVGIADSDPVTIELQALGAGGVDLGSAFLVTIPEDTVNPGNGYFVVEDLTPELYGLEILQPTGDAADFSGLAISDVQVAPEPASLPVIAAAVLAMAGLAWRRRKA